jgi:hypothetical protein
MVSLRHYMSEFLKFVGPSDRRRQIFGRSDRSLILGGPIVRQTFFCCFVCNGFAKHDVPWLLISCLTDCLCNLGSKYNDRICPGFINSKFGKQSYPQSFCNIIVDWCLNGGIRGFPLKKIAYNLVIADSYQI